MQPLLLPWFSHPEAVLNLERRSLQACSPEQRADEPSWFELSHAIPSVTCILPAGSITA